jgi:hypothetical protein
MSTADEISPTSAFSFFIAAVSGCAEAMLELFHRPDLATGDLR